MNKSGMEGYLHKKDGQYLTYFESFDLRIGKPVNKKGTVLMKGCDVKLTDHKERNFSFAITKDNMNPVFLQADNDNLMKVWMNALKNAAMGIYGLSKRTDFSEFYEVLNLPKDTDLSISTLTKQYRKLALKMHPDKGGNAQEYERLQEAYNILKSHLEEIENDKLYNTVHYHVTVEKGPAGVGLGMLVVEDKKKAQIRIKQIQPNMLLRYLDPVAKGKMKVGDFLVAIEDENTVSWPLARVVQRLNDYRVPVGSTVSMTFARNVRKDGQEEADEETPQPEVVSPPMSPVSAPSPSKPTPAPPLNASSAKVSLHDIDEDEPPLPTYTSTSAMPPHTVQDDATVAALRAENEELIRHLEVSQAELKAERELNDRMRADLVALSNACKTLKKEEMRLKIQLQQLLSNTPTVSEQQMTEGMNAMINVAQTVMSGQQLKSTPEVEKYSGVKVTSPTATAQLTAVKAAAAVDPSGLLVKKWAASGDSAASKLQRLESRLKRMQSGTFHG